MVEIEAQGVIDVDSVIGGRYKILSCLGKGGMGTVYKAGDLQSDKLVAVKLLSLDRVPDPQSIARFQQEVRAASLLDHPCLARVYESGVAESGQPYLVMDLIEGTTLASKIEKEAQLSLDETLKIFILVCDGLAYAHAHNILHRDLKPSNIMLTTSGDGSIGVKILDFGLAKFQQSSDDQSHHITRTGELIGSPLYMSPEQARGIDLDQRSDLYSLGCALYESLTGVPPHIGQSPISTLLKRETDQPLPLSEGSLGRRFSQDAEDIVLKLLNIDPAQRFQSAFEVKEALVKLLHSKTGNELPAPSPSAASPSFTQAVATKPVHDRSAKFILTITITTSTIGLIGVAFSYYCTNREPLLKPNFIPIQSSVSEVDNPSFYNSAEQLITKARLLEADGLFDEAAKTSNELIRLIRKNLGPDSIEEADAYQALAGTYISARQEDQAYDAANNAYRIASKLSSYNRLKLAENTHKLADFYVAKHYNKELASPDKAVELFRHAAVLYQHCPPDKHRRPNTSVQAARCLFRAGDALCRVHRTLEGKELLLPAVKVFSEQECSPNLPAKALSLLATCYRSEGNLTEAFNCNRREKDFLEKLPHDHNQLVNRASNLNSLALDHYFLAQKGNFKLLENAATLFKQSLQMCKQAPAESIEQRFLALNYLGDVYTQKARLNELGAYKKAKDYYLESLKVYRTATASLNEDYHSITYAKLGRLEYYQDHMSKSFEYTDLALKLPRSNPEELFDNSLPLVSDLRRKGDLNRAEALCKRLLEYSENQIGSNSKEYANACSELGQIYVAQRKESTAKVYLGKALAIYTKLLGPTNKKTTSITDLLSNIK